MGNFATNDWLTTVIASGGDASGAPSFTIEEMMKALTLPVIVVLVLLGVMLLWCVYVAMERIIFLRRSRLESIELNQALAPHFKAGDGHAALRAARQMDVKISYVQIPSAHADKADKIRETWSEYGSLPNAYLKDISAQLPSPATVQTLGSFSPLDVVDPDSADASNDDADAADAALTQQTIEFVKGVPGLLEDLVAADGKGVLNKVYENDSGLFVVSIDKTKQLYGKSYLAHILIPALQEWNENPDRDGIHAAERAIDTVLVTEGESLRTGLNILATTGSTAPFVGLVGTVFGIINAFREMSSGEAGLKELAPAIGEALVTTAIGIIVAIVGVWLFNYFTAKIESITNKMGTTAQVFMDWCEKRIIAEKKNNS